MTKAERIAALLKSAHNPMKDQKALEVASEAALVALETHVSTEETKAAEIKAAADKKEADDKAAAIKAAGDGKECPTCKGTGKAFGKECEKCGGTGELKAAAAMPTEEEFLAANPALKALVEDKKSQDAADRATLVTSLKTAAEGVYTEPELIAMPLPELRKLAKVMKVDAPAQVHDFSGRGVAVPRTAGSAEDFAPPDGYQTALKAASASKAVN
jgi:hypothetical protein